MAASDKGASDAAATAATNEDPSERPASSLPSKDELREVSDLAPVKLCLISTGCDTSLLAAAEADGAEGMAGAAVVGLLEVEATGVVAECSAGTEMAATAGTAGAAPQAERTGKDTGGLAAAVVEAEVVAMAMLAMEGAGETAAAAAVGAGVADGAITTAGGMETSDS